MYTLIEYSNGITVEAVLLSAQRNRIRVSVADTQDALELTRIGSHWVAEDGRPVEFGFLMSTATAGATQTLEPPLKVRAVG